MAIDKWRAGWGILSGQANKLEVLKNENKTM